jgi:hypothetical protein
MRASVEIKESADLNQITGLLIGKPANQWLAESKLRPIPKMLLGPLWHEGELTIFFGPSGAGKSAKAVQIANDICTGKQNEWLKNESDPQPVLYADFELSDKQFEQRYSEGFQNHFVFDEKFIRLELNPDAEIPDKMTMEDYLINSIEEQIFNTGAKILIVDNITYLRTETEKAKEALPLMKRLKDLKRKYDLSILVLAHTPKRDASKPITGNDLFGSVMLKNFCDSIFAVNIGATDQNIRYLKQIKERFTAKEFGEDNVLVFQIEKPSNFLQFTFLTYGKEIDYLRNVSESEKQVIKEMVPQRHREGKSYREIAKEFNISLGKVQYILKSHE